MPPNAIEAPKTKRFVIFSFQTNHAKSVTHKIAVFASKVEFATDVFSKDQCHAQKSAAKMTPGNHSQPSQSPPDFPEADSRFLIRNPPVTAMKIPIAMAPMQTRQNAESHIPTCERSVLNTAKIGAKEMQSAPPIKPMR